MKLNQTIESNKENYNSCEFLNLFMLAKKDN